MPHPTFTRRQLLKGTALGIAAATASCPENKNRFYEEGKARGGEESEEIIRLTQNTIPMLLAFAIPYLTKENKGRKCEELEELQDAIYQFDREYGIPNLPELTSTEVTEAQLEARKFSTVLGTVRRVREDMWGYSQDNDHKLRGIVAGALGRGPWDILGYIGQNIEMAPTTAGGLFSKRFEACSTLLLTPEMTECGMTIAAKNFDFWGEWGLDRINVLRATYVPGRLPSVDTTINIFPGSVTSTNKELFATENWTIEDGGPRGKVPMSCAIQDVIGRFTNIHDAIAHISLLPIGGNCLAPLADADGNIGVIESAPSGIYSHVETKDPYYVVTNHWKTPDNPLTGTPVNQVMNGSSIPRHDRLTKIVEKFRKDKRKFSLDNVLATMQDSEVHQREGTQNITIAILGTDKVYFQSAHQNNGEMFQVPYAA